MKKHLLLSSLILLSACQQRVMAQQEPARAAPSIRLEAINGLSKAQLELAVTPEQQELGLMNRTQMAENAGMLFAFPQSKMVCFWMKNTLIPLTIGFIDAQGVLVNTADMQPQTETPHCATQAVQYAVEMNQGWFVRNRVTLGSQVLNITKP